MKDQTLEEMTDEAILEGVLRQLEEISKDLSKLSLIKQESFESKIVKTVIADINAFDKSHLRGIYQKLSYIRQFLTTI